MYTARNMRELILNKFHYLVSTIVVIKFSRYVYILIDLNLTQILNIYTYLTHVDPYKVSPSLKDFEMVIFIQMQNTIIIMAF